MSDAVADVGAFGLTDNSSNFWQLVIDKATKANMINFFISIYLENLKIAPPQYLGESDSPQTDLNYLHLQMEDMEDIWRI